MWVMKADTLWAMGRENEALTVYDEALTRGALVQPEHRLWKARKLEARQHYEDALASCDVVLSMNLEMSQAWQTRASILKALRRDTEAVEAYDRAIALRQDSHSLFREKADFLFARARIEEALAVASSAVAARPQDPYARVFQGDSLSRAGQYDQAIASYNYALTLDPHSGSALTGKMKALFQLGRVNEALALYAFYATFGRRAHGVLQSIADELYRGGHLDAALAACDRLIERQPPHPFAWELWKLRGQVLTKLNRFDEALIAYDSALVSTPSGFGRRHLHSIKADCLYAMGRGDEANEERRRVD